MAVSISWGRRLLLELEMLSDGDHCQSPIAEVAKLVRIPSLSSCDLGHGHLPNTLYGDQCASDKTYEHRSSEAASVSSSLGLGVLCLPPRVETPHPPLWNLGMMTAVLLTLHH